MSEEADPDEFDSTRRRKSGGEGEANPSEFSREYAPGEGRHKRVAPKVPGKQTVLMDGGERKR